METSRWCRQSFWACHSSPWATASASRARRISQASTLSVAQPTSPWKRSTSWVGEAGDVPGVGGLLGAALAGVAGEAFQGGGAEEVDLGPGAALDAVDRAGPGVGAVRAAIAAVAFDERKRQGHRLAVVIDRPKA